jgi:hypothetical protein
LSTVVAAPRKAPRDDLCRAASTWT